jgi:hypothetical protein
MKIVLLMVLLIVTLIAITELAITNNSANAINEKLGDYIKTHRNEGNDTLQNATTLANKFANVMNTCDEHIVIATKHMVNNVPTKLLRNHVDASSYWFCLTFSISITALHGTRIILLIV